MRFSAVVSNHKVVGGSRQVDIDGFIAECQALESAGFYAAYTGEKHAGETMGSSSPLLFAALALARTTSLTFGTNLIILPVHHPVTVAEDAAVMAALFPDRFRLTVGAGYFSGDFEPFGVPLSKRGIAMEEGLAAIRAFQRGTEFELRHVWRGKVPHRDPALGANNFEVFMGAWSEGGVKRAARLADGWITDPIRSGKWIQHLADTYRAECERVGKRPRIVLWREAWLGTSDRDAQEVYGPYLLNYHRLYWQRGNAYDPRFDPWLHDVTTAAQLKLEHVLQDRVLCGGATLWKNQLHEWAASLQPEEVMLRLRFYDGPEFELAQSVISRIGEQIIVEFAGG